MTISLCNNKKEKKVFIEQTFQVKLIFRKREQFIGTDFLSCIFCREWFFSNENYFTSLSTNSMMKLLIFFFVT